MRTTLNLLFLATLFCGCLCAGAGEEAVDKVVKVGVDAALQKRIDAYILEGRKALEEYSLEGPRWTPAGLRRAAEEARCQIQYIPERYNPKLRQKTVDGLVNLARKYDRLAEAWEKGSPPAGAGKLPSSCLFGLGMEEQVLMGLALVQAGMKPSDPLLEQLWERVSSEKAEDDFAYSNFLLLETRALSVMLQFAEAMMHAPCGEAWPSYERKARVKGWVQKTADRLARGCRGGTWSYYVDSGMGDQGGGYLEIGKESIGSEGLARASNAPDQVMNKGKRERDAIPYAVLRDCGSTYQAVLGLKAAARCGVNIDPRVWRLVAQQLLNRQNSSGPEVVLRVEAGTEGCRRLDLHGPGRSIVALARRWDTLTLRSYYESKPWGFQRKKWKDERSICHFHEDGCCANPTEQALTCLMVAKSELDLSSKEKALVDEAIVDGLAWVQYEWEEKHVKEPLGHDQPIRKSDGRRLRNIERLGVLGNLKAIGGHAWYAEGALGLVDSQPESGDWTGCTEGATNTAYRLLFLCRGASPAYEVTEAAAPPAAR